LLFPALKRRAKVRRRYATPVFLGLIPALKRRATVKRRYATPMFLGLIPVVETPGYSQTTLRVEKW